MKTLYSPHNEQEDLAWNLLPLSCTSLLTSGHHLSFMVFLLNPSHPTVLTQPELNRFFFTTNQNSLTCLVSSQTRTQEVRLIPINIPMQFTGIKRNVYYALNNKHIPLQPYTLTIAYTEVSGIFINHEMKNICFKVCVIHWSGVSLCVSGRYSPHTQLGLWTELQRSQWQQRKGNFRILLSHTTYSHQGSDRSIPRLHKTLPCSIPLLELSLKTVFGPMRKSIWA